jgi:hypothetical protein
MTGKTEPATNIKNRIKQTRRGKEEKIFNTNIMILICFPLAFYLTSNKQEKETPKHKKHSSINGKTIQQPQNPPRREKKPPAQEQRCSRILGRPANNYTPTQRHDKQK